MPPGDVCLGHSASIPTLPTQKDKPACSALVMSLAESDGSQSSARLQRHPKPQREEIPDHIVRGVSQT
jgi:hypothetical protein